MNRAEGRILNLKKGGNMDTVITRFGATALKKALLLGVIGALLTGYMVVNTVSSTDISPAGGGAIKLASQTFSDDTQITVSSNGIKLVPSTDGTAVGDSAPGVEPTISLPEVTTAVTKNNYAYEFVVKETAAADWAATDGTDDLKIEVYGDDGTTTTLIATFYVDQATADIGDVEGVTGTVDLGSSSTIYDTFDVIVTHQ